MSDNSQEQPYARAPGLHRQQTPATHKLAGFAGLGLALLLIVVSPQPITCQATEQTLVTTTARSSGTCLPVCHSDARLTVASLASLQRTTGVVSWFGGAGFFQPQGAKNVTLAFPRDIPPTQVCSASCSDLSHPILRHTLRLRTRGLVPQVDLSEFVQRKGSQLLLDGKPFYFAGFNNYYMMTRAADSWGATRAQVQTNGVRNMTALGVGGCVLRQIHPSQCFLARRCCDGLP
jgi:hypothetical protein